MSSSEKPKAETRPTAIDPLFPSGEAVIDGHRADEPADGRAEEAAAGLREEGRHRVRVLKSIQAYLGRRNRRRPAG